MEISHLTDDGLKQQYKIIVSATDMNNRLSSGLAKIAAKVKMPGFRPGKVPVPIVEQRYGDEVKRDVLDDIINKSVPSLIRDNGYKTAVKPSVYVESYSDTEGLVLLVDIELLPEIVPVDFKQINLEKFIVEFTNTEADEALKEIHEHYQHFEDIKKPRPVQEGDRVSLEIEGDILVNNTPTEDISRQLQVELSADQPYFSGALEKELVGKSQGTTVTISDTIPKSCDRQDWVGAVVHFTAKLAAIQEPIKVDLDDNFAKLLKADSLDKMKVDIQAKIISQTNNLSTMMLKKNLLDQLSDLHPFNLPQSLVDEEFEAIWKRLQHEIDSTQAYDDSDKRTEEELKEDYRHIAERRVRLGLLFSEISKLNQLKVTEEELRKEMLDIIESHPNDLEGVAKYFSENKNLVQELSSVILENKVVDIILSQVNLKEVPVSMADFRKKATVLMPNLDDEDETIQVEAQTASS